ncbi:MAG: biotin--[acetyl-CoA-carboxylase] ligase [Puniceicoccales bacterium]|jgi:BirA family biotin operon repressor/biotin-[acetyl-CoA-carboxylase] ligase|nr:biotin--[acetyl-CoA-carboxylase] ligase [Puniceicoccales bacterium]
MDTRRILETFLAAGGAAVSGDKLARSLGVSRVAVWGRLERLRAEGFVFEAAPRVGYRLVATPPVLHGDLLAALLAEAGTPPATLRCPASVDSTNDAVERLLTAGEPAPVVVATGEQTAGRGRHGRPWLGTVAGNVCISFGFRPALPPERMRAVTLAVGLRLCERLRGRFGAPLQIKWPNDLQWRGRKVAGILTEARVDADRIRDVVVGVGLNVRSRCADFPSELRDTVATLAEAAAGSAPPDVNLAAAECAAAVLTAFADYEREGLGADFGERWARLDALAGRRVASRSITGGVGVSGIAEGVDADGALRVRDAAGAVHALDSGEVTLAPPVA